MLNPPIASASLVTASADEESDTARAHGSTDEPIVRPVDAEWASVLEGTPFAARSQDPRVQSSSAGVRGGSRELRSSDRTPIVGYPSRQTAERVGVQR
jgi:hypothetical protein